MPRQRPKERPKAPPPPSPSEEEDEEDSEENLYEEAEALRLKTPSPELEEPPRKKRRDAGAGRAVSPDVSKYKKEKKRKKEKKEGKEGQKQRSYRDRPRRRELSQSGLSQSGLSQSQASMPWPYAWPMPMHMPAMAMPAAHAAPSKASVFKPGAPMPPQITAAPAIPTLHSVMTGEVQLLTPKGALVLLSDDSPQRYVEGLLRRRSDERPAILGAKLYVKVVRIEAGMVIVDARGVDQDTGKDQDPEHDQAEVEEWVDVPVNLVGRIIGKKGERIRQICDDTGADLRFDGGPAEVGQAPGANTKKTTGGAGDDMRKFLEAAQDDDEDVEMQDEPQVPKGSGDDLRAFLEEAKAGSAPPAGQEATEEQEEDEAEDYAEDLAAFLQEVKADKTTDAAPKGRRNFVPAVEFVAYNLENWDEMLYRKMGEAGVTLVYPENLTIIDKEGNAVEIAKGLRHRHFPIRVRYILTSDTYAPEKVSTAEDATAEDAPAAAQTEDPGDVPAEDGKNSKAASKPSTPRPEAICISGAENLTKMHLDEVLEAKSLPEMVAVEHISKSSMVVSFRSASDAKAALDSLGKGFDDVEHGSKEGPGLYRARHGLLKFRLATSADVKAKTNRFKHAPKEEYQRLRINGDAKEVKQAKKIVLDFLDEFSGRGMRGLVHERFLRGIEDVEESFEVPPGKIGRLIGKGGENIKKMEDMSGARLRVLPAAEEGGEQRLLVSGAPDKVEKAKELLRPFIPTLGSVDPKASGVPLRKRLQEEEEAEEEVAGGEELRGRRHRAAEVLESAARREGRTDGRASERPKSRDSSTSSGTRVKRLREKKRAISMQEYQAMLKKQKELDAAAARAEEAAQAAAAHARRTAEEDKRRKEEAALDNYDWEEETGPSAAIGRLALTSFGAGKVSRTVVNPAGRRFVSFQLLAGGVVQVPETTARLWLASVDGAVGAKVSAPQPWDEQVDGKGKPPPPPGASWVISEAEAQGRRLAFRLASPAELFPRFVEASQLSRWPRTESVIYLVELCTTPQSVGHVAPFRHDYRKSERTYAKGDTLVVEGCRPGLQDLGVVRKVLLGDKGAKVAALVAAKKDAPESTGTLGLAFQRGGPTEAKRREGLSGLERMVLPLLAARLPASARALGVGASLDGTFLRFFLRLVGQSEQALNAASSGAAAAAAAVGAMLGCQTEVLASTGPEEPEAEPPTQQAHQEEPKKKAKPAKEKRKTASGAKKKAKEKKAAAEESSSSESSESSSGDFLLAMAKR
ncbi:FUBP3, partial [Symbiodinium natans]